MSNQFFVFHSLEFLGFEAVAILSSALFVDPFFARCKLGVLINVHQEMADPFAAA